MHTRTHYELFAIDGKPDVLHYVDNLAFYTGKLESSASVLRAYVHL